jgi:RimJ/RimL family protein N-acetyltransferase
MVRFDPVEPFQAETDTRNAASARVLEELGFVVKERCGRTAS